MVSYQELAIDPETAEEFLPDSPFFEGLQIYTPELGGVYFSPRFLPDRIRVRKQRELDRQTTFCSSENVSDSGEKNREIHISGKLREVELDVFNAVLDAGELMRLICEAGAYNVYVDEGEIDGPVGIDHKRQENLWDYSLDLVTDPELTGQGGSDIISGADRLTGERENDAPELPNLSERPSTGR